MSKILKGIKISEADRSEAVANWGLNRNPSVAGPKEYAIRVRNGGRFIGDRYKDEKQAHRVLADLQKNYADFLHVVEVPPEVPSKMNEGGNVFKGKTAPIKIEDIDPTLLAYFAELKTIFPKKAAIFDEEHFHPLGSVRKKALSGDIDLGISVAYILDKKMSDESIAMWGIDPAAVAKKAAELQKRARSSTPEQSRLKAFLQLLVLYINSVAPNLYCDEKKVTDGNIFGFFPQVNPKGENLGIGVQIDWMIGNIDWLKFSYYSAAYPKGSNVKGLHRTQLMLSAFQVAGLSFNHVTGVKDKATGEIIADDPENALSVLGKRLGFTITQADAEDYYRLQKLFQTKMSPKDYSTLLDIYFKILDSTRADIPDNLQSEWVKRKDSLGLTGKFLPDDSKLKSYISESGVAGADRVKSRQDFQQFLKSYKDLISQFPGFVSLNPSGSYNSNLEKNDFGDIDLIVHIQSDQDKATVKKQLQAFFMKQPETVIVPFSSAKHAGKRSYNAGELVSVRYHDDQLGYSAQIDNIVALDQKETNFKQLFLDMPAEKQGLILGLVKIAVIEEDKPRELFDRLGINNLKRLAKNQEYEFSLSSSELQLRKVTYEPGTYKQIDREVIWSSKNFDDVQKLLYQYDLNAKFDDLLKQAKRNIRKPRSGERMKGIFSSMITVKSGEVGTPKGAGKEAALAKIQKQFSENRSIFKALVEMQDKAKSSKECGKCLGLGRMVWDADIGTDQECFVCDGTGKVDWNDDEKDDVKEGSVTPNFKIVQPNERTPYDIGKADSYYGRERRPNEIAKAAAKEYLRGYKDNDDLGDYKNYRESIDPRKNKLSNSGIIEGLGLPYPGTYEQERGLESADEKLDEKWSDKYKRSIDCSHPKGFSQRAHCQGKKKKK